MDEIWATGSTVVDLHAAAYLAAYFTVDLWITHDPTNPALEEWWELLREAATGTRDVSRQASVNALESRHALHQGRVEEARTLLEEGIEILQASRHAIPPGLAPIEIDLAMIALYVGDFPTTKRWLDLAESHLLKESAYHGAYAGKVYGLRAGYFLRQGLPDRAARWVQAMGTEAEAYPQEHRIPWVKYLTEYRMGIDDHGGAVRGLREELSKLGTDPKTAKTRASFERRLAVALKMLEYSEPGQLDEARDLLLRVIEGGLLAEPNALGVEIDLADVALRRGDLESARRWVEAARSREQRWPPGPGARPWDEMAELSALEVRVRLASGASIEQLREAHGRLEQDVARFLEVWRHLDEGRGGTAILHITRRQLVVAALIESTLATNPGPDGARQAFEVLCRVQGFGGLARSLRGGEARAAIGTKEIVHELLPEGGGLLAILPADVTSHAFAVDAGRVVHAPLPHSHGCDRARWELIRLLKAALRSGRAEDSIAATAAAQELAEVLLPAAIRERLEGWNTVTISGIDTLGYVPFEALPLHDGELLGDRMPVAYLPSPSVGFALAARRRSVPAREIDAVVLAAPAHGEEAAARWPGMKTLDWDSRRGPSLLEAYAPARVRLFTGEQATRARLLAMDLSGAALLQLVVHGGYDYSRERPACLVLGPNGGSGILTGDDVEGLRAPPLVILTACGAAGGPLRRGEDGGTHLGGAFLTAGAQAVVLSHIDVEYQASLRLMREFHLRLRDDGDPPAVALFHARRALREESRFSRPEYRCLIHVSGLGFDPAF